ncbi:MAG: PIN domain-containing protein [Chloroflexota bacterium]
MIKQCEDEDDRILIPSIVLGEVLCGIPDDKQQAFIRQIEKSFVLAPYDARASVRFSRMWKKRERVDGYTRSETKADFMIAAVAVANACKCIYTNDDGLKKFAESSIPVITIEEIPVPPKQTSLFDDE